MIDNRGGELMANVAAQAISRMRLLNWGHLNMLEVCILSGHRQLKFAHCSDDDAMGRASARLVRV